MAPSGDAILDLTLPVDPATPRTARSAVAERLGDHDRCGDVLVCVSEAVTNAVIHARTEVRFVVRDLGPRLRVEVSDLDPTPPVLRRPDPRTPNGRGMLLIDELSSTWGVDERADGKTVWFELA